MDKGQIPELPKHRSMPRRMETPPLTEITTTVGKSGTGAHVFVPKDWIGKKVRVILLIDTD